MSRPLTPSVNVICISQDGLNFVDEFDDLIEDFDRTPRPEVTLPTSSSLKYKHVEIESKSVLEDLEVNQLLSSKPDENESGSHNDNVAILECSLLLSPRPNELEPRSVSAGSKRPLTGEKQSSRPSPNPSQA